MDEFQAGHPSAWVTSSMIWKQNTTRMRGQPASPHTAWLVLVSSRTDAFVWVCSVKLCTFLYRIPFELLSCFFWVTACNLPYEYVWKTAQIVSCFSFSLLEDFKNKFLPIWLYKNLKDYRRNNQLFKIFNLLTYTF